MIFEGRNPAREELVQLIKEHDKDGNGTIGVFSLPKFAKFQSLGLLKRKFFKSEVRNH